MSTLKQSSGSASKQSTNLVTITPYPTSSGLSKQPKKLTQDLGAIRNMVSGWEHKNATSAASAVRNQRMSDNLTLYPSDPYMTSHSTPPTPGLQPMHQQKVSVQSVRPNSINISTSSDSISPIQRSSSPSAVTKQARDAFFTLDSYPSQPSGNLSEHNNMANLGEIKVNRVGVNNNESPLNIVSGGSNSGGLSPNSYLLPRFASVERLSQRQNIYDSNNEGMRTSPEPRNESQLPIRRDITGRDLSQSTLSSNLDSGLLNSSALSSTPRGSLQSNRSELLYSRNRELGGIDNVDTSSSRDKSSFARDSEVNVGFSDLPNRIHRKTIKKGFEFTLMVVGESRIGKSTLINSMFLTDIYSDEYPGPSKRATKTVDVHSTKVILKEKNVNLSLTIVDTPGFAGSLDNSNCWQKINEYIESRYEEYMNAETELHRTQLQDNRVHCCLYFLPAIDILRDIDIEAMKSLQDKVNIIPIIAKADTLVPEECQEIKKIIMNEIHKHQIRIYEFPDCDEEDDVKLLKNLKARIPFAVCSSSYIADINGERKRVRKYPWGSLEIENLEHCDFIALRLMLIKYFMLDLVDTTKNVHYENYRCRKLAGIGTKKTVKESDLNPLAIMEEERKESEKSLQKLEQDLEQVFENKAKVLEERIKENENQYLKDCELSKKEIEKGKREIMDKRQAFEKERDAFNVVAKEMEEIRKATLEANSREIFDGKEKKKEKKRLF